jgi:hypothetical protein
MASRYNAKLVVTLSWKSRSPPFPTPIAAISPRQARSLWASSRSCVSAFGGLSSYPQSLLPCSKPGAFPRADAKAIGKVGAGAGERGAGLRGPGRVRRLLGARGYPGGGDSAGLGRPPPADPARSTERRAGPGGRARRPESW